MSVGEGSAVMVDDVAKFVDPVREELNMLYHFDAARIRNTTLPDNPESGIDYSLIALKKMFTEWDKAVDKGWYSIYLGNHDQPVWSVALVAIRMSSGLVRQDAYYFSAYDERNALLVRRGRDRYA